MPIQILSNNKMEQLTQFTQDISHRAIYPSCIHAINLNYQAYKHMYINSRIIQTKQKRLLPFFSVFC